MGSARGATAKHHIITRDTSCRNPTHETRETDFKMLPHARNSQVFLPKLVLLCRFLQNGLLKNPCQLLNNQVMRKLNDNSCLKNPYNRFQSLLGDKEVLYSTRDFRVCFFVLRPATATAVPRSPCLRFVRPQQLGL